MMQIQPRRQRGSLMEDLRMIPLNLKNVIKRGWYLFWPLRYLCDEMMLTIAETISSP